MRMKRELLYIVFAAFGAAVTAACAKVDDSQAGFTVQELGLTDHEFVLDALAGHLAFRVYSNQTCTIEVPEEDRSWLRADIQKVFGDDQVIIDYTDNEGFPRMSKLVVSGREYGMKDTIIFKQKGLTQPTFHFPEGGVVLPGSSSGVRQAAFSLNVDFDDLDVDVLYEDGEGEWVTGVSYTGGKFQISYAANPSSSALRIGQVVLTYVNGWGDKVSSTLNVTQQTSRDQLGLEKTFAQVRAMGVADTNVKISDNIIITGRVVSDKNSRNVGENPKTTFTSIDYTQGDRTVYLQSEDGQYGFEILTQAVDDNIFERYDLVRINLAGATLLKSVSPERYRISGIAATRIVTRAAGTAASLPAKSKYFNNLTDSDIYTYVTLKDCEFPVRKGALTPVHEGYTLGDNISMLSKYPRLVRDKNGSSFYLYTNTTCPYRRTGAKLPYGSGDLSGVVVFEYMPAYVYGDGSDEETHGRIGTYQIRHQSYSDIKFSDETSFSKILTEYRYVKNKGTASDGYTYWYPTYGSNGRFTHTAKDLYAEGCDVPTTWNYLGPVGTARGVEPFRNNIGNTRQVGLGIILEDNTDYMAVSEQLNSDGKGQDGQTNGWRNQFWWDDTTHTPFYWKVQFSTTGITASHLSCQISVQSGRALLNCSPIYWKAEYSTDGSSWTKVASYQVPDFPVYATYRDWQLPAFKQIDIPLPTSLLGKSAVYLRFGPENNIANTLEFAGGLVNGGGVNSGSAMDYFAIRYN